MSCCQSVFCAADMTLKVRCLIWRYHTHLSQCSVPLRGSRRVVKIPALIANKSQKLLTISHLLQISFHVLFLSLLNRTPGVWQKKSSPSARSLLCQSPLVFLSPSLREWNLYCLFNDTFCACRATAFSSVDTPWYLNGIKQMWWVEHRLNGQRSGYVISPSTLHDVCCWIKETGVLSIRFCCCTVSGMLSSADPSSES